MQKPILGWLTTGLILCLTTAPAWAQSYDNEHSKRDNTIVVQGTGSVTAEPDSFQMSIGMNTQDKTMEKAREKNAEAMQAAIQQIKALGIPHLVLKTSGFSAQPVYEPLKPNQPYVDDRARKIIGYTVSNNLNIKAEGLSVSGDQLTTAASRVTDTALSAGLTNNGGVNFYMSRNNHSYLDAVKLAVKQARETAEGIAEAAGVHLAGVYSIDTQSSPTPRRFARPMGMEDSIRASAMAPTPYEAGDEDVTATVSIRYLFSN